MVSEGSLQSNLNQSSEALDPGPYAPSPLRLSSMSANPLSSNTPIASQYSDGSSLVNQHIPSGMHEMTPQPLKKKRGRPRKCPDGAGGSTLSALSPKYPISPTRQKPRGRPPGSGKKQQLATLGAWLAGSSGHGFTPHVITIAAGEDVASKIMSFSQTSTRAICVLSANGAISNVTLRQPASSGGTVTYEGRFEILSLSGSFLLTEGGGTRSRTGGLSVSLAGPDGHVVGGGVAGMLMAASPVQVVVGSFIAESRKNYRPITSAASEPIATFSAGGGALSTLATPLSTFHRPKPETLTPRTSNHPFEVNGAATSDILHSHGQGVTFMQAISWAASQSMAASRNDKDVNRSLPD